MKKNRMMRLASFLMVAVLLTTSMISGTFAKYTTSVSSEDKARVAYWGFESTNEMNLTDLFADAYNYKDTSITGNSVDSVDDADVIAPGTAGSTTFSFAWDETVSTYGAPVAVTGPEVAYTFTVDVEATCDDLIKANPNIQWKLDKGAWGKWDDMVDDIEALAGEEGGSMDYAPNTLPTAFTAADDTHTISWQWIFETPDNVETADVNETDVQDIVDTTMGNADVLDDCSLKITITATQLD